MRGFFASHGFDIHDSSVQVPNCACDFCGSRFYSNLRYPSCDCEGGSSHVRRIQPILPPGPVIVPLDFPVPMPTGAGFATTMAA